MSVRGVGRNRLGGSAVRCGGPSLGPSLRSVRFSRIGLWAGCVRRSCQLVFLTRYARPFRLVFRLACPSRRGVSWLFFAVRSAVRPASQFARRFVISYRLSVPLHPSRCLVSSGGPFLRLVSLSRSFCSRLVCPFVSRGEGVHYLRVRLSRLVAACPRPRCPSRGIRLSDGGGGMGVPFDDTGDAPFSSARFPPIRRRR